MYVDSATYQGVTNPGEVGRQGKRNFFASHF